MKNKHKIPALNMMLVCFLLCILNVAGKKQDRWEKWLDEVRPIITNSELSVFKTLQTEEDKRRFQKLFWQARDPTPQTPTNEYMVEYYTRRRYAENRLEGANSDRGKIYVLLGEPSEKRNYIGDEDIIDCELWIYKGEGRPGLSPIMYLIFFRPNNLGRYKLFYPGHNTPVDILSPNYRRGALSTYQAYNMLKAKFPELAAATLSIIPETGNLMLMGASTSSAHMIAQIFKLPEREVERSYLRNFASLEGIVDVDYSMKEIRGSGSVSISEDRGFRFLSFSLLPDAIHTKKSADNFDTARIAITVRIADKEGKTIHQQEREINLDLDPAKKRDLEKRKLAFNDFAPLIDGQFRVILTFSNKSTNEFFVYEDQINITEKTFPVLVGYKVRELSTDEFIPFRMENHKVLNDPRAIFNNADSLEGLIHSEETPEVFLIHHEEDYSIQINDITQKGKVFIFKQPLGDVKTGNYILSVKIGDIEVFQKILSVLSFQVEKPLELDRAESFLSHYNYTYMIGKEYLNKGNVEAALGQFKKLPKDFWNANTLPVIARAYYRMKDYQKVIELLEREEVAKDYSVLLLLGNSCLELKKLQTAAEYFEKLRKYGDTVKNNRVLGAIYYSLGEREKAQIYYERAKELEKKKKEKNQGKIGPMQ